VVIEQGDVVWVCAECALRMNHNQPEEFFKRVEVSIAM